MDSTGNRTLVLQGRAAAWCSCSVQRHHHEAVQPAATLSTLLAGCHLQQTGSSNYIPPHRLFLLCTSCCATFTRSRFHPNIPSPSTKLFDSTCCRQEPFGNLPIQALRALA